MVAKGCTGAPNPSTSTWPLSRRHIATVNTTVLNVEEELEDDMTPDRHVRAMSATFHNNNNANDKKRKGSELSNNTR